MLSVPRALKALAVALVFAAVGGATAADRATVVELFTSQGCNSCPPADALLLELIERAAAENLIVLGFHVDYWDYLGWADTMADPAMTERQHAYMRAMDLPSIYTPQMIVGGTVDVIGSDRAAVEAGLLEDRGRTVAGPRIVWFEMQEDGPYLRVGAGDFDGIADVWLIVYGPEVPVEIRRGENAGKNITYGNVVQSIHHLGSWRGSDADFALPGDVGDDGLGRVALIQMEGRGPIVATARLGGLP